MRLKKRDQERLDEAVAKVRGYKTTLRYLAGEMGAAEIQMWEIATGIAKGEEIEQLDHSSKHTKIILKERS